MFIIQFNSGLYFKYRMLVSGVTFIVFYFIHKLITFKDKTTIGLAIHLNNQENVQDLFDKVKNFPDFIHIDLISEDYNDKNVSVEIDLIDQIESKWPSKPKQVHLMSRDPLSYIKKINKADFTYFIDIEFLQEYEKQLNEFSNFKIGFTVLMDSSTEEINKAIDMNTEVLILSIDNPGFSGQKFSEKAYKIINYFDKNYDFSKITLDGGVNIEVIKKAGLKKYVSASNILNSLHPVGRIFELRNASKYELQDK